jgi:CRISPR-associated protein Csa5
MDFQSLRELGKALGLLIAEQGSYTYVDKLAYAPSKDLAIFYLREALRDLHSLMNKPSFEYRETENILRELRFDRIESIIQSLSSIKDRRELREVASLIASTALTYSAGLKTSKTGGD